MLIRQIYGIVLKMVFQNLVMKREEKKAGGIVVIRGGGIRK